MNLTLNEEEELVRAAAREFLTAEGRWANARAMEGDPRGYSDSVWRAMGKLGWTGLAIPEAYGGIGAGFLELCLVVEELGRAQVPSPLVPTTVLGGLPVARFGTEEQKRTRLPGIARGDRIVSYTGAGFGRGWELEMTGVRAVSHRGSYVLSGHACFVPYVPEADELLVVARRRHARSPGVDVFLVDTQAAGVSWEAVETVGADRQYRVEFDEVRVPEKDRLGRDGRAVATAIGEWGGAAVCAEMIGGAERVLEMTVAHAQDRHQFGRPIGSFQAIQHHCANMAVAVLGSRWIGYEAIWRLSQGEEASEHVSMAKAWISDAYQSVCALAHQVHGAIGFTKEHDLHRFYRHAHVGALAFGDSAWHRERVAEGLAL